MESNDALTEAKKELARVTADVDKLKKVGAALSIQIKARQADIDVELGKIIELKKILKSRTSSLMIKPSPAKKSESSGLVAICEQALVAFALDDIMTEKLEGVKKAYSFYYTCLETLEAGDEAMVDLLKPSLKASASVLIIKLKDYLMTFPSDLIGAIRKSMNIEMAKLGTSLRASPGNNLDIAQIRSDIKAILPTLKEQTEGPGGSQNKDEALEHLKALSGFLTTLATIFSPDTDYFTGKVPQLMPLVVEVRQVLEKSVSPDDVSLEGDQKGKIIRILNGVDMYIKDLVDKFAVNLTSMNTICDMWRLELPDVKMPEWLKRTIDTTQASRYAESGEEK